MQVYFIKHLLNGLLSIWSRVSIMTQSIYEGEYHKHSAEWSGYTWRVRASIHIHLLLSEITYGKESEWAMSMGRQKRAASEKTNEDAWREPWVVKSHFLTCNHHWEFIYEWTSYRRFPWNTIYFTTAWPLQDKGRKKRKRKKLENIPLFIRTLPTFIHRGKTLGPSITASQLSR